MKVLWLMVIIIMLIGCVPAYGQPLTLLQAALQPKIEPTATTNYTNRAVSYTTNLPFLITLDDGYSRSALKKLIDLRHKYDFPCLLFPYGKALHDNADLFEELAKQGCEVHNHTYNHVYFKNTSYAIQEKEVLLADREIESFYVHASLPRPRVRYFRPPGGIFDANTKAICAKLGYRILLWNVITQKGSEPATIETRVANIVKAKKGSIILLHITDADVKALEQALPVLMKYRGSQN